LPFKEISFIRRTLSGWAREGDLAEIDEDNSFSVVATRREYGKSCLFEGKQGQQLDPFRLLSGSSLLKEGSRVPCIYTKA